MKINDLYCNDKYVMTNIPLSKPVHCILVVYDNRVQCSTLTPARQPVADDYGAGPTKIWKSSV